MPKIGVLALQGDVREHLAAVQAAGEAEVAPVRTPEEIRGLSGLILPGGESTTIGKLMDRWGVDEAIREEHRKGMAVFGTCAGMILLAKRIEGSDQHRLGLMDLSVRRNAFGRQVDSFETDLEVPQMGEEPMRAVFIRAPVVTETGPEVETWAAVPQGTVLVREGRCLAASFHPELTGDLRLHRRFLEMAKA
ncbi:MAG: pyridoxal 5'-phosphate synthase glutaminase subunit PdxT [Armatimonadetes bacterium]|nr:pyridoxal 5'-phosphate synthase glutaminase subunit PdxT [Armatimonadota bacterium]